MRESVIEKNLVREVESRGGITYKLSPIGRINKPDRLVMLPGGTLIFVECKAPNEKPRPGQIREHERLRKIGFKVIVLDSLEVSFLDEK
ncbi:VRR-NUC domain-containing protein [Orbaceae bacterium ESL0721]|nr:VRR-NUC domain-containing protein [Orbaceae bacterium ESL0721]